jgi:hypothetical protein
MTAIGLNGKAVSLRDVLCRASGGGAGGGFVERSGGRGAILSRADAEAVKGGRTGRGILCAGCRSGT